MAARGCLSPCERARERGRMRNRQREVKDGDILSSLLNWMATPQTGAENTERSGLEKDDE